MTPPTRSPSPDDGLKGLPGGGVYPIEFSPEFLASIDASQEGGDAGDIYGIKYINKPGTITDNSLGKITKKQGEDAVAGFPHEKGMTMLDVKEEEQEREFVMVWNEDRASFTIYPVTTTLTLSENKPLSEENSPKSEAGKLPSIKGKSATKAKQPRANPPPKPKATATKKKADNPNTTKGKAITKVKPQTTGQGEDLDTTMTKQERGSGKTQKSKETSSPPSTVPVQHSHSHSQTSRKTIPIQSSTLKSTAIIDDSDDSMAEQEDEEEEEEEEEDDFAALLSAEMAKVGDTDIEMEENEPIVIVDDSTESEEDDDDDDEFF